jgi:hypothetical protein
MLNQSILFPFDLFIYIPEIWFSITVAILLVYVVLPGTKKQGQWAQIKDIDYLAITISIITIILLSTQLKICLQDGVDSNLF